jgi:hypothetical protein
MLRIPHCILQVAVNLSALYTDRTVLLRNIIFSASGTYFCSRLSKPQGLWRLDRLGNLRKKIHSLHQVSNLRLSGLQHSSSTTTLPRAPYWSIKFKIFFVEIKLACATRERAVKVRVQGMKWRRRLQKTSELPPSTLISEDKMYWALKRRRFKQNITLFTIWARGVGNPSAVKYTQNTVHFISRREAKPKFRYIEYSLHGLCSMDLCVWNGFPVYMQHQYGLPGDKQWNNHVQCEIKYLHKRTTYGFS